MSNPGFNDSQADMGGVIDVTTNTSAYSNLIANRTVFALGAAAALALAGASASGLANYSGTNYNGSGSCQSYNVSSVSDPVLSASFGGQQVASGTVGDLDNFSTVYNTNGGATSISLTTADPTGHGRPDNASSTILHKGSPDWQIDVSTVDTDMDSESDQPNSQAGQIVANITINGKSQAAYDGEKLPDGSTISFSPGEHFTIVQPLIQGGATTTEYTLSYGEENYSYLNVDQSANGAAVVNGAAISEGMSQSGEDSALLALPCSSVNASVTPGTMPDGSQMTSAAGPTAVTSTNDAPPPAPPAPTPPPPPPPAMDTNASQGAESQ